MSDLNDRMRFGTLDLFTGGSYFSLYRHFIKSFSWSRDDLLNFQNQRIRDLIEHSYRHVPYYRALFDDAGVHPSAIKTVDDLKKIPVLTREQLRNCFNNLQSGERASTRVIQASSSGTTGVPIKYLHDIYSESAGIAAGYALYSLSGWHVGQKRFHIWGNPASVTKWKRWPSRMKRKLLNQVNYPAYKLNDRNNYMDLLSVIRKEKPVIIDGYASSIGSFAQWLRDKKHTLKPVKAVFTTAENLTDYYRDAISETLGPVSDLYGSGEINGIAVQPVNDDRYYILEPHVVVECEDFNGTSELIITDLDNRYMPFIRYKIGDTIDGIYAPGNDSPLPFSYFRKLDGRTSDFIVLPNGRIIHPVNLLGGTFLRKYKGIRKHKVIWDGRSLNFELELSEPIDLLSLNAEIDRNLSGLDITFTVKIREHLLPSENGKFRYIEIIKPG